MINTSIHNVENYGALGSSKCGAYVGSHPDMIGYTGAITRRSTILASADVHIKDLKILKSVSHYGSALGLEIFNSEKVHLNGVTTKDIVTYGNNDELASPNSINFAKGLSFSRNV